MFFMNGVGCFNERGTVNDYCMEETEIHYVSVQFGSGCKESL